MIDTATVFIVSDSIFYQRTCSNCHQIYPANKYNAEEWKLNIDRMQVRAMISDKDKKSIYNYILELKRK
ncbi:MAG: hypothetical protein PSX81_10200 [bacterium]|nr:hypothetical protein [bacterium]